MLKLPAEETNSLARSIYPKLADDIEVDVAIVGGGTTGLTSAYLLKKAGLKVAVLEKHNLASGTTGSTTGKVTSQHGLIYDGLRQRLGEPAARIYGEANQAALTRIEEIVKAENIDCGWERGDNYVFTAQDSKLKDFRNEAEAAAKLGLPASFEAGVPLPFAVQGAVKFSNQAKMRGKDFVLGLAAAVNGAGSYVFESSNVTGFTDGVPTQVKANGHAVTAKDIIVATKVPAAPLVARGGYCLLEYPTTSYIVAGRSRPLAGMYISPDSGHYSIMTTKAGGDHLLDGVPLIGKVYPWSKHLYTATAFQKWGLSTSMVAASILRDHILGEANLWASAFKSLRFRPIYSFPTADVKYLKE